MSIARIVLGAIGDGEGLDSLAQMLRDAGHEVVFVGGYQSPEQLVCTALAEDAVELVVAADEESFARLDSVRRELDAEDIELTHSDELVRAPRIRQ